nr:translation initiation factor IF-6 [bacterium]
MAFVPPNSPEKFSRDLREALEVEVHTTEIAEMSLLGAMIVINDNGIVLPRNTTESELAFFRGFDAKVGVIEDRHTALGNLVLANDKGAVASGLFSNR